MILQIHKVFFVALLLFAGISFADAQTASNNQRIDELVQLHIDYNKAFPYMPGYRIQLFMASGNDALDRAEQLSEKFQEEHAEVPAYITFGEPYYRVRVGDFRTRLDAIRFLQNIKREYPQAWVVKDKINFPTLSSY